ncbi:MAG: hypothetical protein EOO44_06670 [Flavobacterium sp.]|nr:MAG: hypothetical protein EOO44_06670 [Flavobacterium sp.]
MTLAETNNHRYEDQFFQFDQMQYEVRYNVSKPDHSITENAEPDYGDDLKVDESDDANFGNEKFDQESNEDSAE